MLIRQKNEKISIFLIILLFCFLFQFPDIYIDYYTTEEEEEEEEEEETRAK